MSYSNAAQYRMALWDLMTEGHVYHTDQLFIRNLARLCHFMGVFNIVVELSSPVSLIRLERR